MTYTDFGMANIRMTEVWCNHETCADFGVLGNSIWPLTPSSAPKRKGKQDKNPHC